MEPIGAAGPNELASRSRSGTKRTELAVNQVRNANGGLLSLEGEEVACG